MKHLFIVLSWILTSNDHLMYFLKVIPREKKYYYIPYIIQIVVEKIELPKNYLCKIFASFLKFVEIIF